MKAKLLAVLTALLLATGCQAESIQNEEPQVEDNIEQVKDLENKEESNAEEEKSESDIEIEDQEDDVEKSDSNVDEDTAPETDHEDVKEPAEEQADLVVPPEDAGLEEVEEALFGGIPNDDMKGGILEACDILEKLNIRINDESLPSVEFDGLYETYHVMPYASLEDLKAELRSYFTSGTTMDIIEMWGLLEYNGQVLASEVSPVAYAHDGIEVKLSDVDDHENTVYVNLSFMNQLNQKKNSLVVLVKDESGKWKLDTIPGTGLVKSYDGRFIRDMFWVEGNIDWNWPEFIVADESGWKDILTGEQEGIRQDLINASNSFSPDEAFEKIGADQLNYWITWGYSEAVPEYPSFDITISEYIKYGIHPNHSKRTITLSKSKKDRLLLSDVYSDEVEFTEDVNVFIDEYMREHKDAFYSGAVFEGIHEGTQFFITENGIVFYFQLYEYAPYAYGFPQIEVPFEVLKEHLSPEFQVFVQAESDDIIEEQSTDDNEE